MSDIPYARVILRNALRERDIALVRRAINRALRQMWRETPDFRAPVRWRKLTPKEAQLARRMRRAGYGVNDLVFKFKTNGGRISEALNPQRRKQPQRRSAT